MFAPEQLGTESRHRGYQQSIGCYPRKSEHMFRFLAGDPQWNVFAFAKQLRPLFAQGKHSP